jgi:hypothetical protein
MEPELVVINDAASKETPAYEQPVQGLALQAADPEQHHQTCSMQLDTKRPADGDAEGADEHAKRPKVEQQLETLDASDAKQDNSTGACDSVSDEAGSDVDEQGVLQLSYDCFGPLTLAAVFEARLAVVLPSVTYRRPQGFH